MAQFVAGMKGSESGNVCTACDWHSSDLSIGGRGLESVLNRSCELQLLTFGPPDGFQNSRPAALPEDNKERMRCGTSFVGLLHASRNRLGRAWAAATEATAPQIGVGRCICLHSNLTLFFKWLGTDSETSWGSIFWIVLG